MLEPQEIKQIAEEVSRSLDGKFQAMGGRFVEMEGRFTEMEDRFVEMEGRLVGALGQVIEDNINPQFDEIRARLGSVEGAMATMVTESYLDDKLADLKGEFTVRQRTQDRKVNTLINTLDRKKVLAADDVHELNAIEVFPKLADTV